MNESATPLLISTTQELHDLAAHGGSGDNCDCRLAHCKGWESITDTQWPAGQMHLVGDLREPGVDEPTFEELHTGGTRYESPDAPIALAYFPVNRSQVWRCGHCGLQVMRYTEFGGYYIDHRVRVLDVGLVVAGPSVPSVPSLSGG